MRTTKTIKLFFVILIIAGLCACSADEADLPEPGQLFETIQQAVQLPEMVDVVDDFLEANTGISASEYTAAVYYIPIESVTPDEIVIIRAADSSAAADIQKKLEAYLAYRVESARVYLTEYMPVLQAGVVRRDGLTVSMIISEHVSEIVSIYDNRR